ncbi:MAG: hypothetical protein WC325_05215 [Candidatus Bathyarchaeia archaeon]|jgi:hypothetical protein
MIGHKKILVFAVCAAVFLCFSGITWALVNGNTPNDQTNDAPKYEVLTPEQVRNAAMEYIAVNHPETEQFMTEFSWTGGIIETGLLGASNFVYESQGWTVSISYAVVLNPTFDVTVDYTVPSGTISVPYSVNWAGNCANSVVTETGYVFAQ